ncbi:MAG: type II toxin-antitoxin system VapC family toxin [Candidatus Omnitrophica bacterium]|nr:type II toxin-antitoxin system VapC family toxin [Candidatus Omnitrophota bacterium]
MAKILDTSALWAYFSKEPGYEKVRDLFIKAASGQALLMTTVHWGEMYYLLVRDHGDQEAGAICAMIDTFPLEIIPVDRELARQAALYKIQKKLPFVDSFAAALAKLRKGELVTADKDFKAVDGDIKIIWAV